MRSRLTKFSSESVARITLDHVKTRNALSYEMLLQLKQHFEAIHQDQSIKVVVLDAIGPAFSSGHDLRELYQQKELFPLCSRVMQSIVELDRPVIAQIDGIATAAGCQLVASCDLAIASTTSRFATPGVDIGLFCSTPAVAIGRSISRKHAMKMLLTGEFISADEASRIGLINQAVKADELQQVVDDLVEKICEKSQTAIHFGKPAFYQQLEMPLDQAYELTTEIMQRNAQEDQAKEGISAFLQKRKPTWST